MIEVHISGLSILSFMSSSSRYLFLIRCEPALVLCVYAFALCGSIDGEQLTIIELFALGAIASRCAFLLPVPSISGHSPLSSASVSLSSTDWSFICLNIVSFTLIASTDSNAILCCCK